MKDETAFPSLVFTVAGPGVEGKGRPACRGSGPTSVGLVILLSLDRNLR